MGSAYQTISAPSKRPPPLTAESYWCGSPIVPNPASAFAGPLCVTARRDFPIERLQTRIDRLAFKGEDTKDAFVDAAQRFLSDKSLQRLNSESELVKCQ
jgi:hypothetical protein